MDSLPVEIGSYVVERVIWECPTYADYEAHHRTLGHRVLFRHEQWPSPHNPRGSGSIDPIMDRATELDALEGLRRSRRLQAELQHPRIVPIVDFFEHDGEWFSVFAQIPDAQSLRDIVSAIQQDQRPPYNLAEFVALSAGVTDGLAALYRAGFVHRTLGANNIIVDDRGYVRLADIGCATRIGADDAAARAFRRFLRPASAAPEQFAAEGVFSPATDMWALGVALFELRYGRHPYWPAMPAAIEDVVASIVGGEPRFPEASDEAGEALLQSWLRRLLERVPEKRYGDALEAQRDLQTIAAEIDRLPPVARAFVAVPFATAFDAVWRAIRSACAACRVATTRIDQSHRNENIWDEICDAIRSSDFTIAVATPDLASVPNPNVMIEIGYARALHKPVLLLTDNPDSLPFDLRTQRALVYANASIGGGEFHRLLASFISGLLERTLINRLD
jgi:serine/threonine protein kinase